MSAAPPAPRPALPARDPALVLRTRLVSARVHRRSLVVGLVAVLFVAALTLTALCLGDLPVAPGDVLALLVGHGQGIAATVVLEWRLPHVLAAVVFGAALGASGAIFQSLTRNPLASPDIIGLSAGSYTGGLIVIIVFGATAGSPSVSAGALVGGLATAAVVYALSYRRGIQGFRLIIIGIGVAAMLQATSTYLLLRAKLEVAMVASVWGAGSLSSVGWDQFTTGAVAVTVVFAVLVGIGPSLRQLELGDDAAKALGSRVERSRLVLVICGVALTAIVTACAGPIAFVALAAPQIAQRVTRSPGTALVPSALAGALVLLASDLVAQHALPVRLPVGIVTVVVGGAYLVWLLVHESRRRP